LHQEIVQHFKDQDLQNASSEESAASEAPIGEGIDANESTESYLDEQVVVDEELIQNQSEETGEVENTLEDLPEEDTSAVDTSSEMQ